MGKIIDDDILFIKSILPAHYVVKESNKPGSIHCKSRIGLRNEKDDDDDEHWSYIYAAIKQNYYIRFQEIDFNTCAYYCDFTIYLRPVNDLKT